MAQQQRFHVRRSTNASALASPSTHLFRPSIPGSRNDAGAGYYEYSGETNRPIHRSQVMPQTAHRLVLGMLSGNCAPPSGTAVGSQFYLKPPGGAQPILCSYLPSNTEGPAWMPVNKDGKRMAFTVAYLASHGWAVLKAAMREHAK